MAITINGSGSISGISAGGLPDGVVTTDDLASTLDLSGKTVTMPVGAVLQVVQGSTSTQVDSTSSTYSDTGLSASITPSSASNKILVLVCQGFYNASPSGGKLRLVRDASVIQTQGYAAWSNNPGLRLVNFQYLDSPATTSSITYKLEFNRDEGSATLSANYDDGGGDQTSFITLMEIAA